MPRNFPRSAAFFAQENAMSRFERWALAVATCAFLSSVAIYGLTSTDIVTSALH
jgi:hypothetical protein